MEVEGGGGGGGGGGGNGARLTRSTGVWGGELGRVGRVTGISTHFNTLTHYGSSKNDVIGKGISRGAEWCKFQLHSTFQ